MLERGRPEEKARHIGGVIDAKSGGGVPVRREGGPRPTIRTIAEYAKGAQRFTTLRPRRFGSSIQIARSRGVGGSYEEECGKRHGGRENATTKEGTTFTIGFQKSGKFSKRRHPSSVRYVE